MMMSRRFSNSLNNIEWVTGIYTRTIHKSKYMDVGFHHSSCPDMFQWDCLHWNITDKWSDLVHFQKAKKKAPLRIKGQLVHFICNAREAWREAKKILEDHLNLSKSFGWRPYDPNSFICDMRMKNMLSPYIHRRIPEIEQYANMDE